MMILAKQNTREAGTPNDNVVVSFNSSSVVSLPRRNAASGPSQTPEIFIAEIYELANTDRLTAANAEVTNLLCRVNVHALKLWQDLPARGFGVDSSQRDAFEDAIGPVLTGFAPFAQEVGDGRRRLAELDRIILRIEQMQARLEEVIETGVATLNHYIRAPGSPTHVDEDELSETIAEHARSQTVLRQVKHRRDLLATSVERCSIMATVLFPRWQHAVIRLLAASPGMDRALAGAPFAEAHCDLVFHLGQDF